MTVQLDPSLRIDDADTVFDGRIFRLQRRQKRNSRIIEDLQPERRVSIFLYEMNPVGAVMKMVEVPLVPRIQHHQGRGRQAEG